MHHDSKWPVIVFFYKTTGWYAKAMKRVTGGPIFHTGILRGGYIYEMSYTKRRRPWGNVLHQMREDGRKFLFLKSPVDVPEKYMIDQIIDANTTYGILDYLGFLVRPLYHALGLPTRNMSGVICSELVTNYLKAHGWQPPIMPEVPSPYRLFVALGGSPSSIE